MDRSIFEAIYPYNERKLLLTNIVVLMRGSEGMLVHEME